MARKMALRWSQGSLAGQCRQGVLGGGVPSCLWWPVAAGEALAGSQQHTAPPPLFSLGLAAWLPSRFSAAAEPGAKLMAACPPLCSLAVGLQCVSLCFCVSGSLCLSPSLLHLPLASLFFLLPSSVVTVWLPQTIFLRGPILCSYLSTAEAEVGPASSGSHGAGQK